MDGGRHSEVLLVGEFGGGLGLSGRIGEIGSTAGAQVRLSVDAPHVEAPNVEFRGQHAGMAEKITQDQQRLGRVRYRASAASSSVSFTS